MLIAVAVFVAIAMSSFLMFAAWHKRIGAGGIFSFGVITIGICVVIANLPRILSLGVQTGEHQSFNLQLQEVRDTAQRVDNQAQQVQTDTSEVRQMKEQIEALLKRVEQGEQTASHMSQELTDVQKQQIPRRLSAEQKQTLVRVLSPFPGQKVLISCVWGDGAGKIFAEDFSTAFSAAGWVPNVIVGMYDHEPVGFWANLNKGEVEAGRIPEAARALFNTLADFGLLARRDGIAEAFTKPDLPADEVEIQIGRRPAPGESGAS